MLDSHLIAETRPLAGQENIILWNDCRITVLADRLFRVETDKEHLFCDEATQSVWFRDAAPVSYQTAEKKGKLHIRTSACELVWGQSQEDSYLLWNGKRLAIGNAGNLLGTYRTLDQCDGSTFKSVSRPDVHPLTLDMGVVSRNGLAVLDDSASLLLKKDGTIAQRKEENDIYIFAYGHDYRGAVKALFALCGHVPLIPRFALGNWWSRYHAYSDTEYLHILDRLENRDIPLTVATIDMDWHWSNTADARKKITESGKNDDFHGGKSGWTGYSWNTDLFPDYKKTLKEIHSRGLKITLNLHPATGIRWFEDMYKEMAEAMGIDPATEERIPFDLTSDRFINAYFKIIHKPYEHNGVDFWWIDWQHGTQSALAGLDPLWALNHYHTYDSGKEHAPLILSRYSGIGAHRYPIGFSGDTYVTWDSLAFIPYFTATASNAGYTWWSHDIGGHMRGIKDDELYTRYVQFGVFSPINRLHCSCEDNCTKEPTVYMNGAGLIAEEFLRLRHRMIPYLYSADVETNENGRALIEPMYYEYPENKEAYQCKNQYLFGSQLLVAPVVSKGKGEDRLAKTKVWLPQGHWTDIFTGDEYDGNRFANMYRFMDSMPVLAKEGGFFVLDSRRHTNSIDIPDDITVMIFNGNGTYTLHEDTKEGRTDTVFVSKAEEGMQTVSFSLTKNHSEKAERTVRLQFRNIKTATNIGVYENGEKTPAIQDCDEYLTVVIPHAKCNSKYTVTVNYTNDSCAFRNARLLWALQRLSVSDTQGINLAYRALCEMSDEEGRLYIRRMNLYTTTQKERLLEQF